MKPSMPLDHQPAAVNSKQALQTRILSLVIVLSLALTLVFAYHGVNGAHNHAKEHLNVATTFTKNTIDAITQGEILEALEQAKQAQVQTQMHYLWKYLDCRLYIINGQKELLFTDTHGGGPFGTTAGQQLQNLPSLNQAINELLSNQAHYTTYDGERGQQMIHLQPLASPDTYIIGDISSPTWYTYFGGTLYVTLFIILIALWLTHKWVKQAIKDWRRQNLSQTIMDSLTSFPNRRGMELFLQQAFATPASPSHPHSLLLISLDHFAQINIHYGTVAGDMLLKQIATRIRTWLPPEDLLGRWDGDTFLILHKGNSNIAELAEKIVFEINKIKFNIAGETVQITVSTGVYMINDPDTQRFSLAHTERALRKAKQKEGHQIVYSNGMT